MRVLMIHSRKPCSPELARNACMAQDTLSLKQSDWLCIKCLSIRIHLSATQ